MEPLAPHIPVMLPEVLASLAPQDDALVVDGTFGAGGYSRGILEAAQCRVVALDRDPNVELLADVLARDFPGRFFFVHGRFGRMVSLLAEAGITRVDGIVLDIGVSSMQLDQAERGFSFRHDAPLDMRMSVDGVSAADVVNGYDAKQLTYILKHYGEERAAGRIATAIVRAREEAPIASTLALARIIESVVPKHGKTHPATKSFQAIRMEVNAELKELEGALHAAETLLAPGGRLVVVSFHSLEDRMVKQFLRSRCGGAAHATSRHDPSALLPANKGEGSFVLPKPSKILPDLQEQKRNPRARSARLRVAIRTEQLAQENGHYEV
jgi:16S rRNA (cytosine1402-N4)-methyltransferase